MKSVLKIVVLVSVAAGVAACSTIEEVLPQGNKEIDYKHSKTLPPLEIPPDLSMSTSDDALLAPGGTTTYSTYTADPDAQPAQAVSSGVLATHEHIEIKRDGDKRWLLIKGEPGPVWTKTREFWVENGFLINVEDPRIGIMETDWAENRADIPQGPIRKILSTFLDSLYSAATRDKFRVRIERGPEPGTTELYLSHRGAEEVSQGENYVWQARSADPELEAEMLGRLMVHLGVEDKRARRILEASRDQGPRAQLVKTASGDAVLTLQEDFSRAWRRTGLALDRIGFTVEDRDRSRGIFYVRYIDTRKDAQGESKGWLSKLNFWSDDKPKQDYLISLTGDGQLTRVVVLDTEGKPYTGKTAGRILGLLHDELK